MHTELHLQVSQPPVNITSSVTIHIVDKGGTLQSQGHPAFAAAVNAHGETNALESVSTLMQIMSVYFAALPLLLAHMNNSEFYCYHPMKCFGRHHPSECSDQRSRSTMAPPSAVGS